jgi:putative CocE/NonD family hydrolase
MALATNARRVRSALDELPLVEPAKTLLESRAPWYNEWVTQPDLEDPFWAPMQHAVGLDRVEIPILLFGGWQDIFLEQTTRQYRHLHDRGLDVAMTIGPWSHIQLGTKGISITTQQTFDWLEEHLARRGRRRRPSPVHIFVTGANQWRDLPSWPPATDLRSLYLHPGRGLSEEAPPTSFAQSTFTFDPAHPTPSIGGPVLSGRCIVEDTTLSEGPDVLSFTGPVLEAPIEVLGAPVLELAHQSDNSHADLFVRVSEVDRKGRSHNVTEGYMRLDPARTGELVTVTLRDAAHRFAVGTRIRLLIAGGSHPKYARNLGTNENPGTGTELRPTRHSIAHGSDVVSRLLLPTSRS